MVLNVRLAKATILLASAAMIAIFGTHSRVTTGVYRRIRHPMYAALFLCSVGRLLALPNWIAGPS